VAERDEEGGERGAVDARVRWVARADEAEEARGERPGGKDARGEVRDCGGGGERAGGEPGGGRDSEEGFSCAGTEELRRQTRD
jgi:hypothetical protein